MGMLETLGMKYPDAMAPLEQQYRKYELYGKIFLTVVGLLHFLSIVWLTLMWFMKTENFRDELGLNFYLYTILLVWTILFWWWAIPFALVYYPFARKRLTEKKIRELINVLITNSNMRDYQNIARQTGISKDMFNKAINSMILTGRLKGRIVNDMFIPLESAGNNARTTVSTKQINRLKGILKVKRQITTNDLAHLFEQPVKEVELMIYEIIGAGNVNLTINEDIISLPENQDVDSVIDELDSAFKQWEKNVNSRQGKV